MDFDDVSEWSLSVETGCMASAHEGGKMTRYIRDMCRFVNLSTTQARVVDITMTIPYLDRSKQPVILSATRRLPINDVRIGPVLPERYDPFLSFPIRIDPNGHVEGRIEFAVQDGGIVSDDLDLLRARATIREARSHQSREIAEGEVYDALKRKAYRGRIGGPQPVWGPRLRRLKRRLRGKPAYPARTPGQMAEEATRRMAEIEQQLATEKPAPETPTPQNGLSRSRDVGATLRSSPKRDTTVSEALAYAVLGRWGEKFSQVPRHLADWESVNPPIEQFREAALRGDLTVWGKRVFGTLFERIPRTYWQEHGLEVPSLMLGRAATTPMVQMDDTAFFEDLMVNRSEVERTWPHA